MDAERIKLAQICVDASHDGSMNFPDMVSTLLEAGFESYEVNYRTAAQTCYLPDGDSVVLPARSFTGSVNALFDSARIEALVHWAQSMEPSYSYSSFSEQAKQAGCAGYLVSFLGRRVVYYGRTAETHVELFPQ